MLAQRFGSGRPSALRYVASLALACALLLPTALPVYAAGGTNGSLTGVVTDTAGHPVVGADVAIAAPTGSYHATTDAAGHFAFTGVVVDTYVISVEGKGFSAVTQQGITIIGDQTVTLPAFVLAPAGVTTIGRTTARGPGSAFQPSATVDTVTISGQQMTEALGKQFSTNQAQLVSSAPGTQIDANGNLIVRGSLATDVGVNFDGVDFTSVDHGGPSNIDMAGASPGGVLFQGFLNGIGSASVTPGSTLR